MMPMRIATPVLLAGLTGLACVGGCSSGFQEVHYFKSETAPGETPNYYRLTVKGNTFISSSRYLSGYFDERAVDTYFNEFRQPEQGRLQPADAPDASKETVKPLTASSEGVEDGVLVLLLSTNSDDVANQLGAIAVSQDMFVSVAGLANAPALQAAAESKAQLSADQSRARSLATLADRQIAALDDSASQSEAQAKLLEFVNRAAADLGATQPFASLAEAETWLRFNRARILGVKP